MSCDDIADLISNAMMAEKVMVIKAQMAHPARVSKADRKQMMQWMIGKSGLSPQQIGEGIGKSRRAISGYRSGEYIPDFPTVFTMAAFGNNWDKA